MIQDWGYNYIYLHHPNATTRIDLRDHSYKDVVTTPVRGMVSIVAHEDSIPSWLVNGHTLWLSEAINESDGESDASSLNYILKPFLEQEFEPHGWHEILATLDVCANVHATKHCNYEGYDLISMNMVSFVLMEEVNKVIFEVKRVPALDYSDSYDEEIILVGSKAHTLKVRQLPMSFDDILISCMPL